MPVDGSYYAAVDVALPDCTTVLRQSGSMLHCLKGLLTGILTGTNGPNGAPPASSNWIVDSSCDGVTAGAGDNLGGAVYTAGKWVRAAPGSAHSWFVLKSPTSPGVSDGPYYILASMGVGAGADYYCKFQVAKLQFTGGTTTADPTTAHTSDFGENEHVPSGSNVASRAHLCIDAAGNFWFLCSQNSSGLAFFILGGQSLTETAGSDPSRFFVYQQFLNSGRGVPTWDESAGMIRGISGNGITQLDAGTCRMMSIGAQGTGLASALGGLNSLTGKADALQLGYVIETLGVSRGFRGRFPDCWLAGGQSPVPSGDPTDAAPNRILTGNWFLPFEKKPSY